MTQGIRSPRDALQFSDCLKVHCPNSAISKQSTRNVFNVDLPVENFLIIKFSLTYLYVSPYIVGPTFREKMDCDGVVE